MDYIYMSPKMSTNLLNYVKMHRCNRQFLFVYEFEDTTVTQSFYFIWKQGKSNNMYQNIYFYTYLINVSW